MFPLVCASEEVPDPDTLRGRFEEAARDSRPCRAAWAVSLVADTEEPGRKITLHVPSKTCPADRGSKLVFVQGE